MDLALTVALAAAAAVAVEVEVEEVVAVAVAVAIVGADHFQRVLWLERVEVVLCTVPHQHARAVGVGRVVTKHEKLASLVAWQ